MLHYNIKMFLSYFILFWRKTRHLNQIDKEAQTQIFRLSTTVAHDSRAVTNEWGMEGFVTKWGWKIIFIYMGNKKQFLPPYINHQNNARGFKELSGGGDRKPHY